MRLVIIMVVIMAIIISTGLWVERGFLDVSDQTQTSLDSIIAHVDNRDWVNAEEEIDQLLIDWQTIASQWNPFVYNTILEDIDIGFNKSASLIKTQSRELALAELAWTKAILTQVQEQEVLSLQNIL